MKKIVIIISVLILALSCRSTDGSVLTKSLLGVVYDNKNNPIQSAKLEFREVKNTEDETEDEEKEEDIIVVTTDIDGKFLIPELDFKEYSVITSAKDCTTTTTTFKHFDKENVLIIKLLTYNDLIGQFKKHLFNKNLSMAKNKIDLIEEINSDDLYYSYLKSIYLIETKEFKTAEEILLKLIYKTEDDAYVNLLLADLYQYHLNSDIKALKYLNSYINQIYTERESKRIKELESVIQNKKIN